MPFDDKVKQYFPDWSELSDKERAERYERLQRLGIILPTQDSPLTELGQSIAGTILDLARSWGSTLEETTGYDGVREYFDRVKATHRHWDPAPEYRAMSLNPSNLARTIGTGVTQSLGSIAATGLATFATGGNPLAGMAAGTATMFGQIYGDRVKEYREAMPNQSEGNVKLLAFLSAGGESLIETLFGPEQIAAGIAKRIATGAMIDGAKKGIFRTILKEGLKSFGTEGLEEVSQLYWNCLVKAAGTHNLELPSWEEVGNDFFGGAIPGFVMGSAGGAVDAMTLNRANNDGKPVDVKPNPESNNNAALQLVSMLGDELGISVRMLTDEEATTPEGLPVNGWYDKENNEIAINPNRADEDLFENLGHELKHYIDKNHSDLGEVFDSLLADGITEEGQAELDKTDADYKAAGIEGDGLNEFSADTFGRCMRDPQFMMDVAVRAEQMQAGMGQKFLDAIQEFINMIRAKLKAIGTPEAKVLFDNMGAIRKEAVNMVAELKYRNVVNQEQNKATQGQSANYQQVKNEPVQAQNPQENTPNQPVEQVTGKLESPTEEGTANIETPVVEAQPEGTTSTPGDVNGTVSTPDVKAPQAPQAPKESSIIDVTEQIAQTQPFTNKRKNVLSKLPNGKYSAWGHDFEKVIHKRKVYGSNRTITIPKFIVDGTEVGIVDFIANYIDRYQKENGTPDTTQNTVKDKKTLLDEAWSKLKVWEKNGHKRIYLKPDFVLAAMGAEFEYDLANKQFPVRIKQNGKVYNKGDADFEKVYNNLQDICDTFNYSYYDFATKQVTKDKNRSGFGYYDVKVDVENEINNRLNNKTNNGNVKPTEAKPTEAKPTENETSPAEENPEYGANNVLVTKEQYKKDLEEWRRILTRMSANPGPDLLIVAGRIAVYHIEAGARKFVDFCAKILADMKGFEDKIKPFLPWMYNSVRDFPGIDEKMLAEMDSREEVERLAKGEASEQTERPDNNDLSSSLRNIILMEADARNKQRQLSQLAQQHNLSEKEVQERCEGEVVKLGREIAAENISNEEKFQKLLDLYNKQPNFSKRTSTSIKNQAYSTPLPLAWILGQRIGLANHTVYEPTAGTGMLTIAGTPSLINVNEIDLVRLGILRGQGFNEVTDKDASKTRPNRKFERVIMNPPFGGAQAITVDGYPISKLDHIIAVKALEAMADDGRAAIIVGANTENARGEGRAVLADYQFMRYLYDRFNVKGNYIVDGELYRKQGASYPVRVIILDGKRTAGEKLTPPQNIPILHTWDDVYQNLNGELENGNQLSEGERGNSLHGTDQHSDNAGQNAENDTGHSGRDVGAVDTDSGVSAEESGGPEVLGGGTQQQTGGDGSVRTDKPGGQLVSTPDGPAPGGVPGVGTSPGLLDGQTEQHPDNTENTVDGGVTGDEGPRGDISTGGQLNGPVVHTERHLVGEKRGELYNVYVAASNSTDKMDVVVPSFMAEGVAESLAKLEEEVGNIDEYVKNELGYSSLDDMYNALSDAQIDAVALMIHSIKNNNGFILGDQTGIGKGRQCAAIIRWAQKNNIVPIFFTKDPKLFTDMYYDGKDIGSDFNPFIIASDESKSNIVDRDTNEVILKTPNKTKQAAEMANFIDGTSECDCIFLPYSQISTGFNQRKFLHDLADNRRCLIIMDEAHEASGDSNRGYFFYGEEGGLLQKSNVNVVYSSATFAKRPDNMNLYFRTSIRNAVGNLGHLKEILARGGVPLQQLLCVALSQEGQYIRRERDFTGVTFESVTMGTEGATDKRNSTLVKHYDRIAKVLKAMVAYSNYIRQVISRDVRPIYGTANTRERSLVETTSFGSVAHNYVAQVLLGEKCDIIVERAIKAIKEGKKPVIALINTVESAIKDYAEDKHIQNDDPIDMHYSDILESAIWRMYKYKNRQTGKIEYYDIKSNPVAYEKHKQMIKLIRELNDIDMPCSPIDYIENKLRQAGIPVCEVTGRTKVIDYSGETPMLASRSDKEKNKNIPVNDFNSGKNDAIILNASGSTGISLHSSSKFKDQRQRHMILAQPSLDIAVVQQMFGRILRSGQVNVPGYEILSSPLAAEKRPLMVLNRKMQSLNANTTANNKGAVSLGFDILNKYGDFVAWQYLTENPEMAEELDIDVGSDADSESDTAKLMIKLTGKMALLPDAQQEEIYEDLFARYQNYVDYLKKTDQYDLEITVHEDWDAVSSDEEILKEGDKDGTIFKQPVVSKTININQYRNIRTLEEVNNTLRENLGKTGKEYTEKLEASLAPYKEAIDNLAEAYKDSNKDETYINDRKGQLSLLVDSFKTFMSSKLMKTLEITQGVNTYKGVITGYKIVGKINPKAPIAASKIYIQFAVGDTVGQISIPYSQFRNDSATCNIIDVPAKSVFTGERQNVRENRIVITGNLLKGLESVDNASVVSYKTHEGNIETALLLPRNFQKRLIRDPRNELHSVDEILKALTDNIAVQTTDGFLSITVEGRNNPGYRLTADKGKKKGGKYYLDEGLLKITGDFISIGREMRSKTLSQEEAKQAFEYLLNKKDTILAKQDSRSYSLVRKIQEYVDRHNANEKNYSFAVQENEENVNEESEDYRYYSLVRDPKTIKRLENEEYITTYRAVQIAPDGTLHSPMAGIINGEWGPAIELGKWEQADEHPELIKIINGKPNFQLNKGNNSSLPARYNPYLHSSNTPLNDQFTSAYKRPELVTLEVRIPKSELTSGYRAQYAKDAVGEVKWNKGVVASHLPPSKKRRVYLSRWDKPIRIVPDAEVAQKIAKLLEGENIPFPSRVVTPSLRAELEKAGVKITDATKSKAKSKKDNKEYSLTRIPENDKDFSLRRHSQVNPIREKGDIQDEYQAKLDGDIYGTRSNATVNQMAAKRIAGNGGMQETIGMMLNGDFALSSDVSQRVMQVVLNSEEYAKLDADSRAKIADIYINDLGTEAARSLAARRLGVLDLKDIKSIQAHVNALLAKIDKNNPDNNTREDVNDITGVDPAHLPEDIINNPDKLDVVLRNLAAAKANKFDKAYEYWINAILSAPTTHAANMMGNISNAVYELGIKRLAEAAINVVAKNKTSATFSEFKQIVKAVDWRGAWDRAKHVFNYEALNDGGKLENVRIAIGGKLGRVIRLPGRLLRAADEFAKAIIQPIESMAYAYREGTSQGLNNAELQDYITRQLTDEKSTANKIGANRAIELTFQEDPGKAVTKLISWRESGGFYGTLLKFMLPFMKTPANILKQGIRKSPLGSVSLAYETGRMMAGKRSFDSEYITKMAEQMLAWGAVAMLASMYDDDDKPFITGTSAPYGSAENRFKANKIPPYSIKIGGKYYSYKRIEPLSTGLAFIADCLAAYHSAKNGEDGTKILKKMMNGMKQIVAEKSFLDSLGQITKIVEDPERDGMRYVTNFAASWMPNAVRQAVNLFDDNVRDNKTRAKGLKWWQDQFKITTNSAGLTKAAPRYDYFGREVKKDSLADAGPLWQLMRLVPIQAISPDDNMNKAERLIWKYNQAHPDEPYYPGLPSFYFKRDGKKLYFEGENYSNYVKDAGQLALKQINNAFKHGLLNENRASEKDIKLIQDIFTRARKMTRDKMFMKKQYSE